MPRLKEDHEHQYEDSDGEVYSIITDDHAALSPEEATDEIDADVGDLAWRATINRDNVTSGEANAAVPCMECGRSIWTFKSKVEKILNNDRHSIYCGRHMDDD